MIDWGAVAIVTVVWALVGGITASIRTDEYGATGSAAWVTFLGGPLSPVFLYFRFVVRGACERVREHRKRREIQLADDYDEVLRLIEWKP